ncbi:S8 family serine peptidase [Ramlibacter sp. 2FC]|uniref:S8 family serine peptidase n=1 Tax=Ramlibacter sp. 2FC TaxID=2502188 RepID=UPI0010FA1D85|nr:S8 family serine peptidase [Ramlibacter sp. 2FC]
MRNLAAIMGLALIACATAAAPLPESSRPAPGSQAARPAYLMDRDGDRVSDGLQAAIAAARPGEQFRVVVTYKDRGPGKADAARRAVGFFTLHREFSLIPGFAATMTGAQIRALALQAGVLRIEEDFRVSTQLDAARADFGTDAARSSYGVSGAGVAGCIVDTGVDPNHEQMGHVADPFFDAVKGLAAAYDDHGHGTHVASIAFGDGTGGNGAATYRGVAPDATIYAAKVLDQSGSGPESDVIAGIEWCANQPAVRIISMSLGTGTPSDGKDALSQAANAAVDKGKVVVVAAGNSGDDQGTVGSPGAAAKAITVGACAEWSAPAGAPNHSDGVYLTPFSSRGPTVDNRIKPDVCAPGLSITAARVGTVNGYITYSGTSMATPFVAGAVALALQASPGLSPDAVRLALESTAQDRGPAGKDNDWGAGLVDVHAFVASAKGAAAASTAFPSYRRLSGNVPNHGLWSYPFTLGELELQVPIGATITIDGKAVCILPFLGSCLAAQWDPDLDARLVDPRGVTLADSLCAADTECGGIGRQETLHAMPTAAGTYTIYVNPSEDSVNLGKGGSFFVELSTGPVAGVAGNPSTMHVGSLTTTVRTVGKTGWTATVTISVHDTSHSAVPNAGVSGVWSGNYSGNSSCTTNSKGQCSVSSGTVPRRGSVTFTVSNLTGALAYEPSSNEISSVTVSK